MEQQPRQQLTVTQSPTAVQLTIPAAVASNAVSVSQTAQQPTMQTIQIPASALQNQGLQQIVLLNAAQLGSLQPQLLVQNQVGPSRLQAQLFVYKTSWAPTFFSGLLVQNQGWKSCRMLSGSKYRQLYRQARNAQTSGGGFFLACKDFGRMFDHLFPTCAFFFFLVEISLYTLIPLSMPGSACIGSVS